MASTGISGIGSAGRRRVEAVVETLAAFHHHGESLGELAHDARNMVTALGLYCDLLDEPGVLAAAHRHYSSELRLLAEASRGLVEKLSRFDAERADQGQDAAVSSMQGRLFGNIAQPDPLGHRSTDPISGGLIDDFREELLMIRGLLAAIPGPSVTVRVTAHGGACPVRMTGENLIRALVNMVKNSAESIEGRGTIGLCLSERRDETGAIRVLVLSIEDSGSGIPADVVERVFEPGFTTRSGSASNEGWSSCHRGMGLSITRSIVEAAGGTIRAEKRSAAGARFVLELPVRDFHDTCER